MLSDSCYQMVDYLTDLKLCQLTLARDVAVIAICFDCISLNIVTMIVPVAITVLIVVVAFCGDKLLAETDYFVYRALFDTSTHGLIGLLSWSVIVFSNVSSFNLNLNYCSEIFLCGAIASLIDLDHFVTAKSFKLVDALNLSKRAPFHSTSLLILIFVAIYIIAMVFKSNSLYRLGWIVFVAGGSHHLRDGVRRGLWFPPFGSTPPLHPSLYLGSLAFLPHLTVFLMAALTVSKKARYIIV